MNKVFRSFKRSHRGVLRTQPGEVPTIRATVKATSKYEPHCGARERARNRWRELRRVYLACIRPGEQMSVEESAA